MVLVSTFNLQSFLVVINPSLKSTAINCSSLTCHEAVISGCFRLKMSPLKADGVTALEIVYIQACANLSKIFTF